MIHKRISWNWENISKCGPKFRPKFMKNWIINEKVHRIRKNLTEPRLAFSQHIAMLEKWFISAFPENRGNISKSGPKAMPKIIKNWAFNEEVHRIRKTSQSRFSLFCTMLKKWFIKSISWNWEDISKSGPKVRPKIMKNWIFNEKLHRIRKTSQKRFSHFCKILRCWRRDSSAYFLKLKRYLKLWPQSYAKNDEKLNI